MSAIIPINAVLPYTQAVATSGQTQFDTDWTCDVSSDIVVYAHASGVSPNDLTQLISPTLYTVTFVGSEQFVRVTFLTGRANGDFVTITRNTPIDRENLYVNTNFTPTMLNGDFGRETFMLQERELIDKNLTPRYNFSASIDENVDILLPNLSANTTWVMNPSATQIIEYELPSTGIAPKDATYVTIEDNRAELPNSFPFSPIPGGIVVWNDGVKEFLTRFLDGTINQINIDFPGAVNGNPIFSIANNPIIPGTSGMGIPAGTTAQRVTPSSGISLRFNTTLNLMEYYSSGMWNQVESSGDFEYIFTVLASHTIGEGASLIGLESPSTANVQDLANLPFYVSSDSSAVAPNSIIFNHSDYLPIAGGTMTGPLILYTNTPATELEAASKGYVDAVARGLNIQASCVAATTVNLTASYDNGIDGVGATLTNTDTLAVFTIDGISPAVGKRVLIKNQSSQLQNGIYTVTNVGSVSVAWVLTRATDFDEPTEIQVGDFVIVTGGTTQSESSWIQTDEVTAIGTDPIAFLQFTASLPLTVINGGTGITTMTPFALLAGGTTSTSPLQQLGLGSAGQVLQSAGSSALPAYSTATYPSTATGAGSILRANGTNWVGTTATYPNTTSINNILFSSANNVISEITTANSSVLCTSSGGVPSWMTTLPASLIIPTPTIQEGIADTIQFNSTPSTNLSASGNIFLATAGENLAFGDIVYIKSDGKLWKADADASTLFPAQFMAIATISADAVGKFLHTGFARNNSWTWTVGGPVYLSTTAGGITQTAPSGSGNCIQVLGFALSATVISFNASPDYITHT